MKKIVFSEKVFKKMLRLVRHYAYGFDLKNGYNLRNVKNLSLYRKRRIINYYYYIIRNLKKQKHVYRPRNKINLRIAQEISGIPDNIKKLKVAFIKKEIVGETAHIRITKKRITEIMGEKLHEKAYAYVLQIKQPSAIRDIVLIDKYLLELDYSREILRVASYLPDDVDFYKLKLGMNEENAAYDDIYSLIDILMTQFEKYKQIGITPSFYTGLIGVRSAESNREYLKNEIAIKRFIMEESGLDRLSTSEKLKWSKNSR